MTLYTAVWFVYLVSMIRGATARQLFFPLSSCRVPTTIPDSGEGGRDS